MFQPIDLEVFLASYSVISIVAFVTAILYILKPEMNSQHKEVKMSDNNAYCFAIVGSWCAKPAKGEIPDIEGQTFSETEGYFQNGATGGPREL